MRPDDVKAALDALASEVPAPKRGRGEVVGRGRRRRLQKRVALVGVAAALIAAVAVVGAIARTNRDKHIVSSLPPKSGPTTAPPGVAAPVTSSVFPSALEAWKCGNPMQYTSDGGQSWQRVPLPTAVPAGGGICTAVPGVNAWATWPNVDGSVWHILRIRGLTDMRIFTLPTPPKGTIPDSPTFIDRDHGWLTMRADNGATTLYRTADGGATWTRASSTQPLGPMAFASAQRGWSVYGAAMFATTDGGLSWKKVALPVPTGEVARFQIAAHGNSVVVWSGVHITGSQYRTFFDVSDDGGSTWALRNGPAGFELPTADNFFDATGATHWQLVSGPELRITDDGGKTWQTRPDLPLPKNGNLLFPISFPTVNIGWVTTDKGKILRTSDRGRTWADVTNGGGEATLALTPRPPDPLAFAGPGEGWICGEPVMYTTHVFDEFASGTNGVTIPAGANPATTTDGQPSLCTAAPGGNAWLLRASGDPDRPQVVRIRSGGTSVKVFPFARISASTVESISFADADNGWASVERDSRGRVDLYRTRDGGATWSLLTSNAPISGRLDFETTTRGWAGGRVIPKLASTTDGGRTWHAVDPPAPRGATLFAGVVPAFVNGDVVVAYGASSTGGRPQPYVDVSTDGGRTWSLHPGPLGVTVPGGTTTGIFSAADADHWALGSANHLYVTDDGGRTWTTRAQFYGVRDIQYVERPSASAMVVSALSDLPNHATVVLAATDSGASWTTVDSWAPPTPNPSVAPYPGGLVGCPTQPLTAPPPGNPPPGLVAAAERYVNSATVGLVYRISANPTKGFGSVFKFAVRSCGETAFDNTWVVEMSGPIGQGGGGSTAQRQVALAHYADGWHVFGRYH